MILDSRTTWAMDEGKLREMLSQSRRSAWPTRADIDKRAAVNGKRLTKVSGKVAVLPVRGIIEQRMSAFGYIFGGVGTDDLGRAIDMLAASKEVQAIVLDIDSPGGTVPGVQALADKIYSYRNTKKMVAIANSCACSAAYWIGSAAEHFYAAPGSVVGSIGVYQMHVDESQAIAEAGIKVTFISAGKFKTEGNSAEPLGDEAKAHLQSLVDADYTSFVKAIARHRGVSAGEVQRNYGEGRYYLAEQAKARKMVDQVATLEEVLGKLAGVQTASDRRGTSVLKLRQAQRVRRGA